MTDLSKKKPYTKLEHYLKERLDEVTADEHLSSTRANNLARQAQDLMQAMRKLQHAFALELLWASRNLLGLLTVDEVIAMRPHLDPVVANLLRVHGLDPIGHCKWCGALAPLKVKQVGPDTPQELVCAWESGCNG